MADKCSICSQPFNDPKCLPCGHAFCRECLQTYINKQAGDRSFKCQLCQQEVQPTDHGRPKSEWAGLFPKNRDVHNKKEEPESAQKPIPAKPAVPKPERPQEEMDESCSICFDPFNNLKYLPCGHKFCQGCLKKLFTTAAEKTPNCPMCRKEIKPEDAERLVEECVGLVSTNKDVPDKPEDQEPENQEPEESEPNDQEPDDLEPENQGPEEQVDSEPEDSEYTGITELFNPPVISEPPKPVEPQPLKLKHDITLRYTEGKYMFAGINDMIMFDDQSFILIDAYYKKVWRLSNSGEVLQDRLLYKEPFGLCLLHSCFLAVSLPSDKKILILNYENLEIKDTLSFGKSYSGLGSDDRNKIYALYHDEYIFVDVISRNDPQSSYEISRVIKSPCFFCGIYRLRVLPSGHVLIINRDKKIWKLHWLDQNGEEFFSYEGDGDNKFKYTSDVAIGPNFIYVADKTTKTFHRFRHQGEFVDTPLTAHEVSYEPNKIYVNREGELVMFHRGEQDCRFQIFSS